MHDDGGDALGGGGQPGELEAAADQGGRRAGDQLLAVVESAGKLQKSLVRPEEKWL